MERWGLKDIWVEKLGNKKGGQAGQYTYRKGHTIGEGDGPGRVASGEGNEEEKIESFLFSPLLSSLLHPLPSFPIQVSKSTALTLHASTSVDGV